jgi:DNA polymerase-1
MKDALYIIDGHGLVYRAYYAFIKRPLITTKGENTSAVFGFMRMLLKLIQDEEPEYLVCTFDTRGKTFRHQQFPEYKAKRLKAPEDLHVQVESIKEIIGKLGIRSIEWDGYEADDLIGTLSDQAKASGMRTVILSSDKDILQLVGDTVAVYVNKKGISEMEILNSEKVTEVWGVSPENITDLLALMGDQSDNIPGVKGIGRITAVDLVQKFKSIENLYEHLDTVEKENVRKLLAEGRDSAFLSKELVTIKRDAPIDFKLQEYRIDTFPMEDGIRILAEKEMGSLVADLRARATGEAAVRKVQHQVRGKYSLINSPAEYRELEREIRNKGFMSFDTESTGRDAHTAEIIGVSISVDPEAGYYIPIIAKEGTPFGASFLQSELKGILEDPSIEKKGQNIKYDYIILRKYGIQMAGITGDSMVAAYLLNPQKQRFSLDDLAMEYLDYTTIHYSDVVNSKDETLLDSPLEKVVEYACEDSDIALRLVNLLEKKLDEENLLSLYREIEIPLIVVLGRMENAGVQINKDYLGEMSRDFGTKIEKIEGEIFEFAGEEFNVRSTKQLARVLFDRMKLPAIKKTKTGYSTDESVLEELSHTYEIARLLLRYRLLTKLKSTYIDSLPGMINPNTGRIYTSFNQTIAATGRLSSNAPNLQNIPIREKEGRAIRRAFVPEQGWDFISVDYSQIELRILASLSEDESLMSSFRHDRDVHRATAALLFGVEENSVTSEQRQTAKTINFSILYGMSPFGLSKRLGISRGEASTFIDTYFLEYSGVKAFFDKIIEDAKANGYVETLLGRRRYIPEITSQNRNIFEAGRRIAINTPIQGTAADLIKKAMVEIDTEIMRRKLRARMLIQVHDELVFESPGDESDALKGLVREKMENAISFSVPLRVNISSGNNWEEAH